MRGSRDAVRRLEAKGDEDEGEDEGQYQE